MDFAALQSEIADRLNLTSTSALARIGRGINERYRWVATTIGVQALARTIVTASTLVGNRSVVLTGIVKVYAVFDPAQTPRKRLDEVPFGLLRNKTQGADPPTEYAIQNMGAQTVTIWLGCTPASVYPLTAEGEAILPTLSGTMVPAFSEDYHDVLIYGVLATELEKMEKYDMAKVQESRFGQRLDQLIAFMGRSE